MIKIVLKLSFRQKVRLIRVIWLQLWIKFLMKTLPFTTFKKVYTFITNITKKTHDIEDYIYLINGSSKFLKTTCWVKALALYLLAADTRVVVGVNNENKNFTAHAWVEKNSKIIIGDSPTTFVPIWTMG